MDSKEYNYALSPQTIARTFIYFLSIVNFFLVQFKILPLELDENAIYEFVSYAWIVGSGIWCWWKDNPITLKSRVSNVVKNVFKEAVEDNNINPDKNFTIEVAQNNFTDTIYYEVDKDIDVQEEKDN